MIIFYSGFSYTGENPETLIDNKVSVMMSFFDMYKKEYSKPNKRFYAILKQKRKDKTNHKERRKHAHN